MHITELFLCCLPLLPRALLMPSARLSFNPSCPTRHLWVHSGHHALDGSGTEGLITCHWEGERPPPLVRNQQGFHWTRSFKLMVWKPNLAIFYLWSTENCEFFTNIKLKKKRRRNWTQRNPDTWLLLKPERLIPQCPSPHDESAESPRRARHSMPGLYLSSRRPWSCHWKYPS